MSILSAHNLRPNLTPLQSQVDGVVTGFVHQATDWRSLAAVSAGGFAYRTGRIGFLNLGASPLLRPLSFAGGLVAEVSAFELTSRTLQSVGTLAPLHANLWSWNRSGGLREGFAQSLITFSALKGAGRAARNENVVLGHLLQDTAMVFGHQAGSSLGFAPRPTGTLTEQFLHAEATNLHLGAGMALFQRFSPGLHAMERGLDLSLPGTGTRFPRAGEETSPLQRQFVFATANGRESSLESREVENEKTAHISKMSSNRDDGGSKAPTGAPSPATTHETAEAQTPRAPLVSDGLLSRIGDKRLYTDQLLRFSRDSLLRVIGNGDFSPQQTEAPGRWLQEVREVQTQHNSDLLELSNFLSNAERAGTLDRKLAAELKGAEESAFSSLRRVREQLERSRQLLSEYPTFQSAAEIRRRMSWVLSLPEFAVDFDWRNSPMAEHLDLAAFGPMSAQETGLDLLIRLHPGFTPEDQAIYERAANGLIRGRNIAFDLNKTLVGTYLGYNMDGELRNHPEKYNGATFNYFAHQNLLLRTPFRGVEAMLLGLWAAGNRLSLYTSDQAEKTRLFAFFNDFPLMKIPFGLATPEDPFALVTPEALHRSERTMYEEKREEFYQRHFNTPEGRRFIEELSEEEGVKPSYIQTSIKNGKIPFPEIPFEVLVDDMAEWAGEMQTWGFGRRFVLATGSAEPILKGLEEYFSRPLPETSPRLRAWLNGSTNSLTPARTPDTLSSEGGKVIRMEQDPVARIATRFKPHQAYFNELGIDKALIERALAPSGNIRDKATLLCEAALKQFSADNYGFHPERHPPLAKLLEVLQSSDPLKEEVKSLLASVPPEHPYSFLKVPLGPYFWMK